MKETSEKRVKGKVEGKKLLEKGKGKSKGNNCCEKKF